MAKRTQKKRGGNKHASNLDRHDRKYKRQRPVPSQGKCGSSYCSVFTGCSPWKSR